MREAAQVSYIVLVAEGSFNDNIKYDLSQTLVNVLRLSSQD